MTDIYEVTCYRSLFIYEVEDETKKVFHCFCQSSEGFGFRKKIRKAVIGKTNPWGSNYFENSQDAIRYLRAMKASTIQQHRRHIAEINESIEYAVRHKKTGAL